jgi:predicted transglutaminase-like cysteine proteinase
MLARWVILSLVLFITFTSTSHADEDSQNSSNRGAIIANSPILAPFQHIRFCMRYPADCKANSAENDRIDLNAQTMNLLQRVNLSVNRAIAPRIKDYGSNLKDGWTIAPLTGDCNDYAVTKRHELLKNGLPSSALRLSVIKTASGIGHLVLVVATTKQDVVLDNLTEEIRPWQTTDYRWLKIQSAANPRFCEKVESAAADPTASRSEDQMRVAGR